VKIKERYFSELKLIVKGRYLNPQSMRFNLKGYAVFPYRPNTFLVLVFTTEKSQCASQRKVKAAINHIQICKNKYHMVVFLLKPLIVLFARIAI
jgi:hypothetical protein